ncbi:hypothetical protein KIN20_005064 [Parelaphostrongylus tenuis]|uniref:Uncharacterized protein n=1 Tax=Parelaphostrongylus tenuis TaxID=148309 RepID=A0AAD5MKN5_PARTN|nr:hypothetical protein KIN20_005064 [Parelaphostrongylus tenuis]
MDGKKLKNAHENSFLTLSHVESNRTRINQIVQKMNCRLRCNGLSYISPIIPNLPYVVCVSSAGNYPWLPLNWKLK